MSAGPIYNPGEPYMLQIPGGFSPGKIAHITGTFTPTANSFILKFQSGTVGDPTDEIGLCMYGRVAEGMIGRNAFTRASGWGQEESTQSAAFARGQNFEVTILSDPMMYKVAINGQHFCEFNHRTNPATMTTINMGSTTQDLHLACLWIEDPNAPPVPPPTQAPYAQAAPGAPGFVAPPGAPSYGPPGAPGYGPPGAPGYGPPGAPGYGPPGGAPGYAPPPGQPMYPQGTPGQYGPPPPPGYQPNSGSNKGLMGTVAGAGAAVAGALGASHLINKAGGGYPHGGGYPGHHGGGGGGLINKAMQMAGGHGMSGGYPGGHHGGKGGGGMMKYAAPIAGIGALGAGGYMLSKGMKHGCHGFHHGSSSSSSSSEEEE